GDGDCLDVQGGAASNCDTGRDANAGGRCDYDGGGRRRGKGGRGARGAAGAGEPNAAKGLRATTASTPEAAGVRGYGGAGSASGRLDGGFSDECTARASGKLPWIWTARINEALGCVGRSKCRARRGTGGPSNTMSVRTSDAEASHSSVGAHFRRKTRLASSCYTRKRCFPREDWGCFCCWVEEC
ncbi:unnamed protein product, partial [Phaeothamnion confervicola]